STSRGVQRARALRHAMTEAERLLWRKLRDRRFGKYKFRRQVPLGNYIADFVCFATKLVIELDGGGHTLQRPYDFQRTAWLEAQGFRVVRFWNHELRDDADAVD